MYVIMNQRGHFLSAANDWTRNKDKARRWKTYVAAFNNCPFGARVIEV